MKNIHIPNPCPEKWSDITLTEKGAHCSKCATEVIDFTNLSAEEIRETLKEAAGSRVCAKMKPESRNIDIPAYALNITGMEGFRSRFLYALVMVFGLTLFSCDSDDEYEGPVGLVSFEGDEYDVGDVDYDVGMVQEDEPTMDSLKTNDSLQQETKIGKVLISE